MASLLESYPDLLDTVRFDARGLVPAIVQDIRTRRVLMLAYMNRESLQKTLETGRCWFYSRSRQALWEKGATSGHYQRVRHIELDCDGDTLLCLVEPEGPACHTGSASCFDRQPEDLRRDEQPAHHSAALAAILDDLVRIIHERNLQRPEGSHTTRLFNAGMGKIAKKVGEEGVEVALASVSESDERLAEEVADLIYYLLVLLEARSLSLDAVAAVLQRRALKRTQKEKRD